MTAQNVTTETVESLRDLIDDHEATIEELRGEVEDQADQLTTLRVLAESTEARDEAIIETRDHVQRLLDVLNHENSSTVGFTPLEGMLTEILDMLAC